MPKDRKLIPTIIAAAIFIILEVAALNMLRNNSALQGIWVSKGAHKVMSVLWGGSESIKYYFSLKKQNEALAEENFRLSEQLSRYSKVTAKPDSTFVKVEGFSYIPAEVIKVSRNKQHNYMILNKGFEDGIQEKSGIITRSGVVGIVDAVSAHHCYALSFQNSDISISGRFGEDGATGLLVWDGKSSHGAILQEVPLQYKYAVGDTVYTSGHSLMFPPDIPLGVAGDARVINGATNEIRVDLFQDFTAIRYVTVVHNTAFDEVEDFDL